MRFAQEALGHNSKAVHQSYAKNAEVIVPSLADWENHWKQQQEQQKPTALSNPTVPLPQPPSPEEDSDDEAQSGLGAA